MPPTPLTSAPLAWVLAAYALMSAVTALVYALDKRRAARGAWRVPERTLHTLELLGGWPGGLVAQSLFRHKRAKPAYLVVFWAIVLLHAAAWALWWRYLA